MRHADWDFSKGTSGEDVWSRHQHTASPFTVSRRVSGSRPSRPDGRDPTPTSGVMRTPARLAVDADNSTASYAAAGEASPTKRCHAWRNSLRNWQIRVGEIPNIWATRCVVSPVASVSAI